MRRSAALALAVPALALAGAGACSPASGPGGPGPRAPTSAQPAALDELPERMLDAPEGTYASVVVHDEQPYLFVAFETGLERVLAAGVPIREACQGEPGHQDPDQATQPCPRRYPATVDLRASVPAAPARVQVLTPSGACDAQVGELQVLVTGNCVVSFTLARPLTGCTGPLAPVARLDGAWDPQLQYHPTPAVETVTLTDPAPSFADAQHGERVRAWLAEPEVSRAPLQGGSAAFVQLDAGADTLVTSAAGFLVGDADAECEQEVVTRTASFIRRADGLSAVADLREWDGALTWRGRVVGVVTGLPHFTVLSSLSPAGALHEEYALRVWSDNDECEQFGWALVEYPCGP